MNRFKLFGSSILLALHAALLTKSLHAENLGAEASINEQSDRKKSESAKNLHLRFVDVMINQAPAGQWMLLDKDGELYATNEILQQWRLVSPAGLATVDFRGASWAPLHALPGYRARFDFSNQSLQLEFAPEAFITTQMKPNAVGPVVLSKVSPAVFPVSYTHLTLPTTSRV